MKLSKIRILNYKSIMDITLEVEKRAKSYTTMLVGKNETGKSNILEAISFLAQNDKEYNYESLKNAQNDKAEDVSFYYTYSFENYTEWKDELQAKIKTTEELSSFINISAIEKNIYLSKDSTKFQSKNRAVYTLSSEDILNKYYFKAIDDIQNQNYLYEIVSEKELSKSENASLYQKLNKKELNDILGNVFNEMIEKNTPAVSKWTYSKEYLITKPVSLEEFKENNDICLPLKNIFRIADIKTKEEVKETIEALNTSPKNINKLERVLEHATSEYISNVWPECNVVFKFKIQNDLALSVYVFDEADEVNSFYMSDRSDGFKQFISLILSISAENNTDSLKNNLILIDEPETHMHPSGIKYMRDELIRIGQNNYVFLSTHSEFMIDSQTQERHYIITKENNNTFVQNWDKNSDIPNDDILRQAFGLSLLSEIVSKIKDKNFALNNEIYLDQALMTLYPDFFVSSEKARYMIGDATRKETSEARISKVQTPPAKKIKNKISDKVKMVISNTKNCFSFGKTI